MAAVVDQDQETLAVSTENQMELEQQRDMELQHYQVSSSDQKDRRHDESRHDESRLVSESAATSRVAWCDFGKLFVNMSKSPQFSRETTN